MAFRFFINIDKCLNMNNFDFFFYRRRYEHKLYVVPDVYIGEGTGQSFRKAAAEVRLYLDRFPYHVGDYQIIIAMRSNSGYESRVWKDTLLSRLLSIDSDLRSANIFTRSGNRVQVAVNLIMLYEIGEIKDIHFLDDNYMDSARLEEDCRLLIREIGVPEGKENDLEELHRALDEYKKTHCSDENSGNRDVIADFFSNLLSQYETDRNKNDDDNTSGQISILYALKELLAGYQIFESFGDKQNRDIELNSLLRIVEFSVTDFVIPLGMGNTVTLPELCREHWEKIAEMDDSAIKEQYSRMLYEYRQRLQEYVSSEEKSTGQHEAGAALPSFQALSDDSIDIDSGTHNHEDPKAVIDHFKTHMFPIRDMMNQWEDTFRKIKTILDSLESSLADYSAGLGKVYKQKLEERKKDEETWHNNSYVADSTTEDDIRKLTEQEKNILDKMDEQKITPSLRFQDQLNMETALEKNNAEINHYISCIQSVTGKSFILLILLLVGLAGFIFALLQPYDFNEWATTVYFAAYLGTAALLMMLTWLMPVRYYRKKIENNLETLKKEMDKYISGYHEKKKQLKEYINHVNQLDHIERHLRLKKQAVATSEWLTAAHTWHLRQAKNHLKKLDFFLGLINLYLPESDKQSSSGNGINLTPMISVQHVDDVFENRLYWPQI